MAERYSKNFATPEEALKFFGLAVYQNQQIIKSAKPGSDKFKQATAALTAAKKQFDAANKAVDAKRLAAKAKADKIKLGADAAKAKEQYEREVALGDGITPRYGADGSSLVPGTQAYFQGSTKMPTLKDVKGKDVYTGSGTKDKPLELNGKVFTGSYKGKEYKNGILVKAKEEEPGTDAAKAAAAAAAATAAAEKAKADAAAKAKAEADEEEKKAQKTIWVSWLRTTFSSLEDKTQKAQVDALFDKAIKQGWDENTFMEALKGTGWWQNTLPSLRQFFIESNDPRNKATFAEKISNNITSISAKLEALGVQPRSVDPATGKVIDNSELIKGIALEAVKNNWTDDELENYLSTKSEFIFTGGGTLGSYLDRVNQAAYLYGVSLDNNLKNAINTSLLDPLDGRDVQYWLNSVKQMAYDAPENKPFLASLQSGRSLYEVTNSYRSQMANLLELDGTAITWNDLMSKVIDKETGNARTFADFTKSLKTDPLWQYTRNAKETYSNMALDVAKMFGLQG